jgi:hypothetical protein
MKTTVRNVKISITLLYKFYHLHHYDNSNGISKFTNDPEH